MSQFNKIWRQAIQRKGSKEALDKLLPKVASANKLKTTKDSRYLASMTKCINKAGFNWSVIDNKWPQFEEAFHAFDIDQLSMLSPQAWDDYMSDTRVVRNWQKIQALRDNLRFVAAESAQYGGFGKFLAQWPSCDQVGLMQYFKKNGSRLGGQTGQWFLRDVGKDGFVLSKDVVMALQSAGLDINNNPSSLKDLKTIQKTFNEWHEETGLPLTHLSRICACSTGVN